jgi:uncharacterized membrane protein
MNPPAVSKRLPRYKRNSAGLEFDRVGFFSDAVFVVAMTLLVVGIGLPTVRPSQLADALREQRPEIISFFVSFVVIGNYWLGHHRFYSRLGAITTPLMTLNLFYLAAIAFMPFPTALAGRYTEDPVPVVMYAVTLGVASGLEAVMLVVAQREQLFTRELPRPVLRYLVGAALVPVLLFFISIPIAFVNTTWALLSWLLIFPLEFLWDRMFKPVGASEVLL